MRNLLLCLKTTDNATIALKTVLIPKLQSEIGELTKHSNYFSKFDPTKRFLVNKEERFGLSRNMRTS